ncbi:MAG: pantetheine-phosphate adenylyltransferase [Planctomycetota bacterium]|nr:pantetheine-phosphate adenylyltransferase [Planctomycetota bacterium]
MDTFPRTAVYPGSFDPPTKGHLDVLKRATGLFDRVVVGIGRNPEKDSLFSAEERVELMTALRPEGVDVAVEAYEGLTVDFAKKHQAVALIRGFRTMSDVESECRLAIANRTVADLETVLMVAAPEHAFTSSRLIREVVGLGGDLDRLRAFVPEEVLECLSTKQTELQQRMEGS